MSLPRHLRPALLIGLCATTFGLAAHPVDPAATPESTPAASDLPTAADAGEVDRRCLQETGSRVTADPQPATPKDDTGRDGPNCAIGNGTVYTRDDIDRTGRTSVKEVLQALDPRVF